VQGIGLVLSGVRREFDDGVVAIDGIDVTVEPGEFVALLGPSGCGKSTLLRLVAGLDTPSAGRVELRDEGQGPGQVAYVFQDSHLLPWRTVLDNVALPLELGGVKASERADAARQALESVELGEWAEHFPAQLSGGMKMRVSLARALVTEPRLLLLDEPFGALDELTRLRLDDQLRTVWTQRRPTVLFVTHSISEAALLAERAIVLSGRPARVIADLPIDLPADRDPSIRTTVPFSAVSEELLQALQKAGK
jgi:NitT/TauT family transport system ATP-binding protein